MDIQFQVTGVYRNKREKKKKTYYRRMKRKKDLL